MAHPTPKERLHEGYYVDALQQCRESLARHCVTAARLSVETLDQGLGSPSLVGGASGGDPVRVDDVAGVLRGRTGDGKSCERARARPIALSGGQTSPPTSERGCNATSTSSTGWKRSPYHDERLACSRGGGQPTLTWPPLESATTNRFHRTVVFEALFETPVRSDVHRLERPGVEFICKRVPNADDATARRAAGQTTRRTSPRTAIRTFRHACSPAAAPGVYRL